MKKFLLLLAIFPFVLLSSCDENTNNKVDVYLVLDDYTVVENDAVYTFEYKNSIVIDSEYTLSEIEILTSDYAVFPYETTKVDKDDLSDYTGFIIEYFKMISNEHIVDSNIRITGLKAKVIFTLVSDNSEIELSFFQNELGEIISSSFHFIDEYSNDIFCIYNSEQNINYKNLDSLLG